MGTHMLSRPEFGTVDKYKNARGDGKTHQATIPFEGTNAVLFTATGAGTTTTLVGAAASLVTSTNCARIGERFMLFDSTGVLKESTVFTVTAHNGTTTITFSPAAAVATASGDVAKPSATDAYDDMDSMDAALVNFGGYTQLQCDKMTMNDKMYALRVLINPQAAR